MQEFELDNRVVGLPDATGGFPRLLSTREDAGGVRLRFDISPELDCFQGHFPGQPVLPGVVQLHWAVLIARACFLLDHVPQEIKRLKFKKVVIPPHELELSLYPKERDEVQFCFSAADEQFSEGRLVFKRADR